MTSDIQRLDLKVEVRYGKLVDALREHSVLTMANLKATPEQIMYSGAVELYVTVGGEKRLTFVKGSISDAINERDVLLQDAMTDDGVYYTFTLTSKSRLTSGSILTGHAFRAPHMGDKLRWGATLAVDPRR